MTLNFWNRFLPSVLNYLHSSTIKLFLGRRALILNKHLKRNAYFYDLTSAVVFKRNHLTVFKRSHLTVVLNPLSKIKSNLSFSRSITPKTCKHENVRADCRFTSLRPYVGFRDYRSATKRNFNLRLNFRIQALQFASIMMLKIQKFVGYTNLKVFILSLSYDLTRVIAINKFFKLRQF